MNTPNDDLTLASDFPPASREMWLKLVDGVLKGAPFERLIGKTADGVRIEPIYERARHAHPVIARTAATPWRIMQRIDHPDAAAANAQALHDLENGATGLTLVFAGANGAAGFGLEPTAEALDRVLRDVYLDADVAIELLIGPQSRGVAAHLAELLKQRNLKPDACNIRFGLDPIGAAAVWGNSPYNWTEIAPALTGAVTSLAAAGFKGPFAVADGRIIHDAGGSEAQELAFTLAVAVAYLRALEAAGIEVDAARRMIYARLSADADQFLTMAKFRALRMLWARIEQSCGLQPVPLFIAAETAWRMLSQRDSDVNMLRATMAVFAAGLGGANSISVLPHTLALGLPDPLARRIARNTHLVLLEESNLAKVSDPVAGAGGVEDLTSQLCTSAWALFQKIEKAGGIWNALEANLIQPDVASIRATRDKDIARRKTIITGVTEFADLQEKQATVLEARPVTLPSYGDARIIFQALTPYRQAEPFEKLRDASDRCLKANGARPRIFLANLGTPADFSARSTFAKSFFEAAGIEAIDNEGFSDDAGLAAAFQSSGTSFACLCSSDKVYGARAATAATALASAGAKHIYLAGRPGDEETKLRAAGVQDFVFAGGDALATLTAAHAMMVKP